MVALDVSPRLADLLRALHVTAGKPSRGPVWALTSHEIKAAARRLSPPPEKTKATAVEKRRAGYGAPAGWTWQGLRATCGTYLTNAPGIYGAASAYQSARRLGHSVTIAERHYLGVVKVPKDAATLEAAMGCEAEIAAIVDAARAR